MATPRKDIPTLESELQKQRELATKDMNASINERISTYLQTFERGTAVEQSLKKKFREKTNEITEQVLQLREEQKLESGELSKEYYMNKHKVLLNSLSQRFEIAMQLAGNKDERISTFDELQNFITGEFRLLENIDVLTLMKAEGLTPEKAGENIPPDYIELLKKIDQKQELNDADWEIITSEMKKLIAVSGDNPRRAYQQIGQYSGFALIDKLLPVDRMKLMEKMLPEPSSHKLIATFVLTGYLTVAQGTELCQIGMQTQKNRTGDFATTITHISSQEMEQNQATIKNIQKQASEHLQKTFHNNYAGKLLSLKGIIGWFVIKNLAINTMIGNIIADPKGFYTNPAFWGGAGLVAGAWEEYSGGFGRGHVTRALAEITKGKEFRAEQTEKEQDDIRNVIGDALGNNPVIADFYFANADKFAQAARKNEIAGKKPSSWSFQELGIDYKSLPEKYKSIPRERLESQSKQFSELLYRTEKGVGMKTAEKQRKFINDTRKEQGLSPFEL